jgi:homospermidine synthase
VIEPWPGHYTDASLTVAQRSNYVLREQLLDQRHSHPNGPTAVSCCGANPGMVSWFVKQALLDIAAETGLGQLEPDSREDWGRLMQRVGVKGIHIAERDTQRAMSSKVRDVFVNTWSVDGFLSEGFQPAELGWGTHEKSLPPDGRRHESGCDAAIYLLRPGANTRGT